MTSSKEQKPKRLYVRHFLSEIQETLQGQSIGTRVAFILYGLSYTFIFLPIGLLWERSSGSRRSHEADVLEFRCRSGFEPYSEAELKKSGFGKWAYPYQQRLLAELAAEKATPKNSTS